MIKVVKNNVKVDFNLMRKTENVVADLKRDLLKMGKEGFSSIIV